MEGKPNSNLPPGFRFHPTDEELIIHYLHYQANSRPCPASIIPEVDIYKFDPWQLPEKSGVGENEWYFFSPRDRKYPNGVRPNRATVSGYWKATGTDKAIYSGSKYVGVKKALVFYKGRPPKGIKTDWIMHEYRLNQSCKKYNKQTGSMRLDDWVLCRIYKKRHTTKDLEHQKVEESNTQIEEIKRNNNGFDEEQMLKFPRTSSIAHLLEMDNYVGPFSQFLENYSTFDNNINNNVGSNQVGRFHEMGEKTEETFNNHEYKFGQVNQNGGALNNFVNPMVYNQFQ